VYQISSFSKNIDFTSLTEGLFAGPLSFLIAQSPYFRLYKPCKWAFSLLVYQISSYFMDCKYCFRNCQCAGKQKNGTQRYFCKTCKKYQQNTYLYQAYYGTVNKTIKLLVCESVGIRGIGRVLKIAAGTVLNRIKAIAAGISKPPTSLHQSAFEVDELWTYIGRKDNEYWLAYALNKTTRKVIDFVIGKRTKGTLKILIDSLLTAKPKKISTDKLTIYRRLIPKNMHRCSPFGTNHIERKNLSIRTHIKRLSRRTICFSRNILLLESCIKIYFWG
jgi:insertion element IS1 protein InsB